MDSLPISPSCLRVLGLTWPCRELDVRRAYRIRALRLHPDRGGSGASFIALHAAYIEALALVERANPPARNGPSGHRLSRVAIFRRVQGTLDPLLGLQSYCIWGLMAILSISIALSLAIPMIDLMQLGREGDEVIEYTPRSRPTRTPTKPAPPLDDLSPLTVGWPGISPTPWFWEVAYGAGEYSLAKAADTARYEEL